MMCLACCTLADMLLVARVLIVAAATIAPHGTKCRQFHFVHRAEVRTAALLQSLGCFRSPAALKLAPVHPLALSQPHGMEYSIPFKAGVAHKAGRVSDRLIICQLQATQKHDI